MLPEKPWSRLHLDHAINFKGRDWLVIRDVYSKYPCIHPTSSTSSKATLNLLEEDFAHFGFPHTLVTDNAPTFTSEEFQSWSKERGITHLTGAPYHPATNGAAERLVQTFKQALRKSSLPPTRALQEFLMQYRRTPISCGFSPNNEPGDAEDTVFEFATDHPMEISETATNSKTNQTQDHVTRSRIRTRIDSLLPSPAHIAQAKQSKEAYKSQMTPGSADVAKVTGQYKARDPVYALYYGPRRETKIPDGYQQLLRSHWVLSALTSRSYLMARCGDDTGNSCDRGTQLRKTMNLVMQKTLYLNLQQITRWRSRKLPLTQRQTRPKTMLPVPEYGPDNPRRSKRTRKTQERLCC
ncbi:uncharacterized protein LOC106873987 [Octopus bimaculoides]|uniref:uncharacterized protein LOC106873987 n=1 Tax=Octopus bimaculoides TaxID=37653 RepID=UPI00071CFCEB|nr:uncharacterized protein LOC106873987 [Octopus bimaculoides]|eukprot:XP_014777021.1 PREDICTED: uncharacterized protein LOC106873987 [Octopus bimaculoides]